MWLTKLSLRRPVTLTMAIVSVVVLGLLSFAKLPLAFLPQVEFPFIGVYVPYPGGIPSEVEREIVRPIEEILATLGGVREIDSNANEDDAFIGVEFDWGREVNLLRMEVQDKINQARPDLPSDVRDIFLFTFNSNEIPIIEGRISAKGRDLAGNWDLIEQRIVRPLEQVPGVGQVGIDGVNPTMGAIYLRLDRILEYNVDVDRLFGELAAANIDLNVGRVTDEGLRYDVRAVSDIRSMDQLAELPIGSGDLRLKDVAELIYDAPIPAYGRRLNGEFAIAFWIQKSSGYNTVETCRGVLEALEEINRDPALQGIDCFTFFNQADQITNSLDGLWKAGLFGSLLSIVVLFVFLRDLRLTLIVSLSIPLSILGTGIWLSLSGKNLNVLSMMGLMLGIGMLVDNAVVVLESIHRRRKNGASPVAAALRGTRDVGRAIIASTLTTVIVFAPIVVSSANELTVWLSTVGATISVTIVSSLFISLTVIPAASVWLSTTREHRGEAGWITWLKARYLGVLRWTTVKRPRLTGYGIVPGVIVLTIAIAAATGFSPDVGSDEGIRQERLRIGIEFTDGVNKRTSDAYVARIEEYLETRREDLKLRDIYSFYAADVAGLSLFFEEGEVSPDQLAAVRDDLRENLPVQAGLKYRFGDEEGNDSGEKSWQITVHGEETEYLEQIAAEAKRRLGAIDGIADVTSDYDAGRPEIQVAVDRDRAARYGVRAQSVAQVLGLTYRGTRLPRLNTGAKEIDLSISLLPDDTESIENLQTTLISVENGSPVLLGQIADFNFAKSPQTIRRSDRRTGVSIRGTWSGEKLQEGLEKIESTMSQMDMPFGYGWGFGRQITEAREQNNDMGINLLLALLCVFFVMASLFESLVHPGIVMGCVPFASLGVIWLMMATGTPFNIMAFIGMVILVGIVVNNGIVLVDHINHYRRAGRPLDDAILAGCQDRLRPILMTAGTTILGLLPLALSGAHMANAQYYPMARAIIGGLISSTLLTLIVLPTYFRLVNGWIATLQRVMAGARKGREGAGPEAAPSASAQA